MRHEAAWVAFFVACLVARVAPQETEASVRCASPGTDPDPRFPTIQCPTQGATGVVSINTGVSCERFGGEMSCGGENGRATSLELSLTPGDSAFTYNFVALLPGSLLSDRVGNRSCIYTQDSIAGNVVPDASSCLVPRRLRMTVSSAEPVVGYPLIRRGLQIPHAYTGHHSETFLTNTEEVSLSSKEIGDTIPLQFGEGCRGYSMKMSQNEAFARAVRPEYPYYDAQPGLVLGFSPLTPLIPITTDGYDSSRGFMDGNVVASANVVEYSGGDNESDRPFEICGDIAQGRVTGNIGTGDACNDKNNWCSMCGQYSQRYMWGNDDDDGGRPYTLIDFDAPGREFRHRPNVGGPDFFPAYWRCPIDELLGLVQDDDDDDSDDDHNKVFAYRNDRQDSRSSRGCNPGDSNSHGAHRRFCSGACADKYPQYLTPITASRMWAGNAFYTYPVYKGMDDCGDLDDEDNTGVDIDLIDRCANDAAFRDGLNLVECWQRHAIGARPPCVDDGDDDDMRMTMVPGPTVHWWGAPVLPGCGYNWGLWPTVSKEDAPAEYPIRGVGRRPIASTSVEVGDDITCSVDDDMCVTALSFHDESHVAVGPPCGCISFENQPNVHFGESFFNGEVDFDINPDSQCNEALFGTGSDAQKALCNEPYPAYAEDGSGSSIRSQWEITPTDWTRDPKPFNICPFTNRDRIGTTSAYEGATDRMVGGDIINDRAHVRHYGTAEAVGVLGPYCTAYRIQETPVPFYAVNVTLEDVSGEEDPLPTQTVRLTNMQQGQDAVADGASQDGVMYVEVDGLFSASGPVGRELGGMIVVCNAARDASNAYDVPSDMSMGGLASADSDGFASNFRNPWRDILINKTTTLPTNINLACDPTDAECLQYELSQLPGAVPLPFVLDGLPGVPQNSWWYYVRPRDVDTYGESCRKIGLRETLFQDSVQAELAIRLRKFGCVPGMPEGEAFTQRQRFYDSDEQYYRDDDGDDDDFGAKPALHYVHKKQSGNNGHYERALRDRMREHTPCMVSSMFQDMLRLPTDCATFQELNEFYGHLPEDWVPHVPSEGTCPAPQYWMQLRDNMLMKELTADEDSLSLRLRVNIANAFLLSESAVLAAGEFVDAPAPACNVVQNSATGRITVGIRNTDPALRGSYIVFGDCTEGISIRSTPASTETTLDPQEAGVVILNLEQTGPLTPREQGGPTPQCSLTLSSPAAVNLVLATLDAPCSVSTQNTTFGVRNDVGFNASGSCEAYGIGCRRQGEEVSNVDDSLNDILFFGAVLLIFLFVVLSYSWVRNQILEETARISDLKNISSAEAQEQRSAERTAQLLTQRPTQPQSSGAAETFVR